MGEAVFRPSVGAMEVRLSVACGFRPSTLRKNRERRGRPGDEPIRGREALGDESFTVVTVGFDWRVDTPDRMRMYASGHGIDADEWYFLSGDAASIDALSANVGFQFFASPKGFDHLSQTTIIDADGTIYRQVYGQDFDAPAIVEPLKELVFDTPSDAGLIEHWVDTFKLFCTVYDPNSGRYRFDYSIFMTILVGMLCLGAIAIFVVREWRHAK